MIKSTVVTIILGLTVFSAAACGGYEDDRNDEVGVVVADTAMLNADAVRIGGFTLAVVAASEWRDGWRVPARITLDPSATQQLGAATEGRIFEVRVFPGDQVRQGDVLVLIHSQEVLDARQRVVAARGAANAADSAAAVSTGAAERAERLLAVEAISVADAQRAGAARVAAVAAQEAAHAEVERARGYLNYLVGDEANGISGPDLAVLRAPFDGVVTGRTVNPGQVVSRGEPLVTVARNGSLGVLLNLPQEGIASIGRNVPVRFTVSPYNNRVFEARVSRVSPTVDSLSHSVQVFAPVSASDSRVLKAEMSVDAELLGAAGGQVLTVPTEAVQVMAGDTVVIIASMHGENMMLEARRVRIGRRTTLMSELLAGAVAGDTVLMNGAAIGKAEIMKRRGAFGEGDH